MSLEVLIVHLPRWVDGYGEYIFDFSDWLRALNGVFIRIRDSDAERQ